jgi:hypothetical protein
MRLCRWWVHWLGEQQLKTELLMVLERNRHLLVVQVVAQVLVVELAQARLW